MNIRDEVKKYQQCRRESTEFINYIKDSSIDFYSCLSNISAAVNEMPYNLSYRKRSVQGNIADILQSVDQLNHELNLLNIDCNIKIHELISRHKIEQLKKERKNAKSTNAIMARRFSNKRK